MPKKISPLFLAAIACFALAFSTNEGYASTGGIDTPDASIPLPLSVGGKVIMNLTNSQAAFVDSSGNATGVITPAGNATFNGQVSGNGVKVGYVETCNSANAGTIRWNGTAFQGCNGASWQTLGASSSPAGTTCGSAARDHKLGIAFVVPCQGANPYYGCPSGYYQATIFSGDQNLLYTCVAR